MAIDFNRASLDVGSPSLAISAASSAGALQGKPVTTEPKKPLVQERPLVDIKVDVEQMRQNLEQTISQLNQTLKDGGRGISFQMDSALNGPIVTVMNDSTGEVIRQLPNAAVVSVAHNMQQLKGLLHNAIV